MRQLQLEHRIWVQKKYPEQTPKIPAVGCLEEAGELVHAILKIEQIQTWGEDTRHKLPELRLKLVDAIGDCGIYACSLCNANEWDFDKIWYSAKDFWKDTSNTLDLAIKLVQIATALALEPQDRRLLVKYLRRLFEVTSNLGFDADAAVRTTWEIVKCR